MRCEGVSSRAMCSISCVEAAPSISPVKKKRKKKKKKQQAYSGVNTHDEQGATTADDGKV